MTPKQWAERYPSFELEEVYSREALERLQASNYRAHKISFELMDLAQSLRNKVGPIYINIGGHRRRGVRTPLDAYMLYKKQGINPFFHSYHIMGLALDMTARDYTSYELFEIAKTITVGNKRFTGFGIYDTFLHGDIRPWAGSGFAYFDKRKQKDL